MIYAYIYEIILIYRTMLYKMQCFPAKYSIVDLSSTT